MRSQKKAKVSHAETQKAGITLWFDRNADRIAYVIIALTGVMALLLFNVRLHEGGDDSAYICRALDLVQSGKYPSFQGPLYPMFLAIFIALTDSVSLIMLKSTSLVLLVIGQLLMYLSLRHTVSRRLLIAVLLLMSFNMWFLSFGSLTYSEPFFYCLQWGLVWCLMRLDVADTKKHIAIYSSIAGLLIVSLFLVRTVGFIWGLAGIVYLLTRRRWIPTGTLVLAILVFYGLWAGIRTATFGVTKNSDSQLQTLLQVDPYDPSEGLETPAGYVNRFIENSDRYISKHYAHMLGLRLTPGNTTNRAVTVIFYALFLWGTWVAFHKNRGIRLVAIAAILLLGATFCSTQVIWDQYRLIIPYVAMMHIVVLYGAIHLLRWATKQHAAQILTCLLLGSTFMLSSVTTKAVDLTTLRINLKDNQFVGYSPDWYNYLGLCYAIGNDMNSDSVYVACRKPNMARIYAQGKKFYGIYTIPSDNPDELVANLKAHGVTHCIIASLRRNPSLKGDGVINTMHRYMGTIVKKYPYFLFKVCQVGKDDDEPATLYKIHYEYANPQ